MGYSRKLSAFERVKPLLDQIITEPNMDITWQTSNPSKLVYWIRQGLHVCMTFTTELPEEAEQLGLKEYIQLKEKYIFRVNEDSVTAERRTKLPDSIVVKSTSVIRLTEATTLSDIVGGLFSNPQGVSFEFPGVQLTDTDRNKLQNFVDAKGYEIVNDNPLSINKKENKDE